MPVEGQSSRSIGLAGFGPTLTSLVGVVVGALAVAYFVGNIEVTNRIIFPSTSSGIILQSGKVDHRWDAVSQTATGGLSKYDTFIQCNPFNGTGFLLTAILAIDNNPANSSFDCSWTPAVNTATGGKLIANNISGTGGFMLYRSGSGETARVADEVNELEIWHQNRCLKCGTITNPTTSFSGALIYEAIDYPGR